MQHMVRPIPSIYNYPSRFYHYSPCCTHQFGGEMKFGDSFPHNAVFRISHGQVYDHDPVVMRFRDASCEMLNEEKTGASTN